MFTNRFFNLFVALLLAVVATLTIRGVVVKANNASSTGYSYDRIKQIQLEHTHSSAKKYDNTPINVYDATGTMLKAIHGGDGYQAVRVYDATGAMLKAVHGGDGYQTAPVYDATGAMPAEARP